MDYSDLEREFQQFSTEHKENTFNRLSDFFNKVRIDFEKEKNKEYKAQ
jgi:hypothetical protein